MAATIVKQDNTAEVREQFEGVQEMIQAYIDDPATISLVARRLIQVKSRISDLLLEIELGGIAKYQKHLATTKATSDVKEVSSK